jgi:hypothetical protein
MRLSDAIALGRTLIIPVQNPSRVDERSGKGCALSMAVNSVRGCGSWTLAYREIWPWLCKSFAFPCDCKDGAHDHDLAAGVIAHLFDQHIMNEHGLTYSRWTLDQLIDWVRSVEPAEEGESECSTPATTHSVAAQSA